MVSVQSLQGETGLETFESLHVKPPWPKGRFYTSGLSNSYLEGNYLKECGRHLISKCRFALGCLLPYGVKHFTEAWPHPHPHPHPHRVSRDSPKLIMVGAFPACDWLKRGM